MGNKLASSGLQLVKEEDLEIRLAAFPVCPSSGDDQQCQGGASTSSSTSTTSNSHHHSSSPPSNASTSPTSLATSNSTTSTTSGGTCLKARTTTNGIGNGVGIGNGIGNGVGNGEGHVHILERSEEGIRLATWKDRDVELAVLPLRGVADEQSAQQILQKYVESKAALDGEGHLLKVVGICKSKDTQFPYYVLTEPYQTTVFEALKSQKLKENGFYRMQFAHQTAKALQALHKSGVVHGAINLHNIVIDEEGSVKLKPPGLVTIQTTSVSNDAAPGFNDVFHAAPELLGGEAPTMASDVFALGVVLFELFLGKTMAQVWRDDAQFTDPAQATTARYRRQVLKYDHRPFCSDTSNVTCKLRVLLERCWSSKPHKRPGAKELQSLVMHALLQKCRALRNPNARTVWKRAACAQARESHTEDPFEVEWKYLSYTLFNEYMGISAGEDTKQANGNGLSKSNGSALIPECVYEMPPKLDSPDFERITAQLLIHQFLTKEPLPASGRVVLKGKVSAVDFRNFLQWFPSIGQKGQTTLLEDVLAIYGHKFFQDAADTSDAIRLLHGTDTGTFMLRLSSFPGSFCISWILSCSKNEQGRAMKTDVRHIRICRPDANTFLMALNNRKIQCRTIDEAREVCQTEDVPLSSPLPQQVTSTAGRLRVLLRKHEAGQRTCNEASCCYTGFEEECL